MVRKVLLLFGLCALSSLSAQEQAKVELFGGYSQMRFAGTNLNGWEASGQYKFLDWLGGVADFDGHYGSFDGISHSAEPIQKLILARGLPSVQIGTGEA